MAVWRRKRKAFTIEERTSQRDRAFALLCSLGLDIDDDGESIIAWGDIATDEQRGDALAVLDPASPTPWHWLGRPRGGSKSTDAAGFMLAIALTQAPPGARMQVLANDREQAALVIDSVRQFVSLTPGLEGLVEVSDFRARVTPLAGGSKVVIEAIAADHASTWGGRPYVLVVDEIGQAPSTHRARGIFTAAFSAIAKVAGSRLVVMTSAPEPSHWSTDVMQAATEREGLWRSSIWAPGVPLPWVEPELLEAQRGLLTESEFARLHLNLSAASEDRLVDASRIAAMVTHAEPLPARPGVQYAIGIDLGLKNDRAAVLVGYAAPRDDDREGLYRLDLDTPPTGPTHRFVVASLDI